MKNKIKKVYFALMGIVPVCVAFMVSTVVNSTSCWGIGQDEVPAGAKKFRKF